MISEESLVKNDRKNDRKNDLKRPKIAENDLKRPKERLRTAKND